MTNGKDQIRDCLAQKPTFFCARRISRRCRRVVRTEGWICLHCARAIRTIHETLANLQEMRIS